MSAQALSAASAPLAAVAAGVNQQGLGPSGVTPSDSTGAIGPIHYIEMVNAQVGLFDRSLNSLATPAFLPTFVGASSGGEVGDVQVQWDQQAGRWLYVALEGYNNSTNNFLAFGWSKGGDTIALTLANSDWCNFHIPTGTDLHDFPKLGHDANFILIGANVYANAATFTTSAIWAIPKPAAGDVSCAAPVAKEFGSAAAPLKHLPPDSSIAFTPVPSNAADGAATAYIVAADPAFIGVWHVSPSMVGACMTPPCLVADGEIRISAWNPAGATDYLVPQPGGNATIDGLDGRLTQAVQHSDPGAGGAETVWTQHTTQGSSGRTVVTWYELNPSACANGVCQGSAKRQEGLLSNPNLYLFNAAISPTSNGDAAVIHYNTGSAGTFVDVRAQSRGATDALNAMSGEFILRSSTVAENDFSCSSMGGPPCRWGDYSGASPDPTSCSVVWGTNMLSGDTNAGGGAPTWVTQNFALDEGSVHTSVSTQQYVLQGSDGSTWVDMDPARLRLASAPCSGSTGLITANADLFTSSAGVNQDIGVFVDVDGSPGVAPLAWKESGGFNGTFSPNAAYVQALVPMPAGHVYTVRLKWKANGPTSGFIFSGAGPLSPGSYSPTRLTLQLLPAAPASASMTTQQKNTGSDGVTWMPIPRLPSVPLAPSVDARLLLRGGADLWTDAAGFNQDIGIQLTGGAFGSAGQVVAWKESGGFNGTFSPNAAFVQSTANLTGGQTYTAQMVWKTNRRAPATASIYAGAGPLPSTTSYSPSSLIAILLPSGTNPFESVDTTQAALSNNDGIHWVAMAPTLVLTPGVSTNAIVSANADLWTARSGFNQDLGIFLYDGGAPAQLLVWKESGGFGGTFSPNAAFAETVFQMVGGHSYRFLLVWKTNRDASGTGATIYAGAGPIAGQFSPTRLAVDLVG
jgi:hypothetical protein